MNTPIDISEYEDIHTERTINHLVQFFEERDDWENPKTYTILEYFPIGKGDNYKPNVYKIVNLRMDYEDGILISTDDEQILNNSNYVLRAFVAEDSVIGIQHGKITISLSSGYIQIYYNK
jgi:hypothetical protein